MARLTPRGRASRLVATLLVLAAVAVCVRLGFWQLDRLEQRRATNAAFRAGLALPPLTLDALTAAHIAARPEQYRYRRVEAVGEYTAGAELVLRGRTLAGRPGVHLLSPLRLEGSARAVLVNRGWVPAADAVTIDAAPLAESGARRIIAIVQLFPDAADDAAPVYRETAGRRLLTLRRLDPRAVAAISPEPLLPFYLQQLPDPALAEPPVPLPPPSLDDGPHLGYALQWFGFATIFLVGLVIVIRRGV